MSKKSPLTDETNFFNFVVCLRFIVVVVGKVVVVESQADFYASHVTRFMILIFLF